MKAVIDAAAPAAEKSNATTVFNNCAAVGFSIATSTDPSIPGSRSSELTLVATVSPSLLRRGEIISSAKNLLVLLAALSGAILRLLIKPAIAQMVSL